MKKILTLILTVLLVGCGQTNEKKLDLLKLNVELPKIADEQFDINHVLTNVEYVEPNLFNHLVDVYDYQYKDLEITSDYVMAGTVRLSLTSAEMYMVFDPVEGKEKALLKELNHYVSERISTVENSKDKALLENALIEHNEDFVALIVSENNEEVLKRIKNSKQSLFGVLTPASDEDLESFGLQKGMVDEYAIQIPVLTSARTYLIVKPNKGQEENVKKVFHSYLKSQEIAFAGMKEELNYVKNAMMSEYEGYQILIISKDNEQVFEAIKTYVK